MIIIYVRVDLAIGHETYVGVEDDRIVLSLRRRIQPKVCKHICSDLDLELSQLHLDRIQDIIPELVNVRQVIVNYAIEVVDKVVLPIVQDHTVDKAEELGVITGEADQRSQDLEGYLLDGHVEHIFVIVGIEVLIDCEGDVLAGDGEGSGDLGSTRVDV